jgi:hypothetical protein
MVNALLIPCVPEDHKIEGNMMQADERPQALDPDAGKA